MNTNPQQSIVHSGVLYMSIELSSSSWKLAFADHIGRRPRIRDVCAGRVGQLKAEIAAAKEHFGLDADAEVISCYEAGRDGFWLHRWLVSTGITSYIGVSKGETRKEFEALARDEC